MAFAVAVRGVYNAWVEQEPFFIDDFGPLPLVRPGNAAELGEVVRSARADRQALYPVGGRTLLNVGWPPARPGSAVDMRLFTEVAEYPARDMTITVGAGITLARLRDLLKSENQRLPIDVPLAEHATLGGALACNTSGSRRLGFGTLRDYVIGIRVVNDEGHEVKAGGRVVKNVAGYDLCKLHIGALGTLGIITQVTLKLRPLAEERALVLLGCDAESLGPLLDEIHASRTRPVCLEVFNEAAIRELRQSATGTLPDAHRVVVVGFEEKRETVGWQVKQLVEELPAARVQSLEARFGSTCDSLWHACDELALWPHARLTFKANLLPHALADFFREAAKLPDHLVLHAHAGNGIVLGHATENVTLERAQAILASLQPLASAAEGNVVVPCCPPAWKQSLPVWGAPRGDSGLMRQVKEKLDPGSLFNPGRFVV